MVEYMNVIVDDFGGTRGVWGSKVSCFGGLLELVCDFGYGWL